MSDNANSPDHVTIIKEGNSGGGMVLGILVAVVLAIVAFMVFSNSDRNSTDASIEAAANKVGSAADKVGNAAQDAAKKVQ